MSFKCASDYKVEALSAPSLSAKHSYALEQLQYNSIKVLFYCIKHYKKYSKL
jgi:hypothetical protein